MNENIRYSFRVEEKTTEKEPEPDLITNEEKKSFIYFKLKLYFLLLGVGSLLPWNSMLTVMDFIKKYQEKYKPDTYYAFFKFLSNIIIQSILLFKKDLFSYKSLLIFSYTASAFSLILLPIVVKFLDNLTGYIISVFIVVILGLKSATCSFALFGLVSFFPKDVIIITSTGQGFSGIIMNIIEMIIKIFCKNDDLNAFILFGIGMIILWFNVYIIYNLYSKNIIFRKVATKIGIMKAPEFYDELEIRKIKMNNEKKNNFSFKSLSLKLLDINILISYIYIVTFAVFPAISLKPDTIFKLDSSWTNNILVAVYNLFDIIGRYIINFTKPTKKKTYINVLSRTIFLITSPLCWILFVRDNINSNFIYLFIIINMSLLGFTNGTSTALCYAIAPLLVSDELKGLAGSNVSFYNIFGIFLGTICAIGTVPLTEKIGNIKTNS